VHQQRIRHHQNNEKHNGWHRAEYKPAKLFENIVHELTGLSGDSGLRGAEAC
jgi:hypothetical protein